MSFGRITIIAAASMAIAACGGDDVAGDPTFASVGDGSSEGSSSSSDANTSSTSGAESESTAALESSSEGGRIYDVGAACMAPARHLVCDQDGLDPFQALGLGCPGDADDSTPVDDALLVASDARSWALPRSYGTAVDPALDLPVWRAREGERFLYLTTGRVDPPDASGVLVVDPGVADYGSIDQNPDYQILPPPIAPTLGSNAGMGGNPFVDCDGNGDCSDTLAEQWTLGGEFGHDLVWLHVSLLVPGGTYGYMLDFAWFSAEYPEWIGSPFNDMLVVWSESEAYVGNLTFVGGEPVTVTALGEAVHDSAMWGNHPALVGTGFDGINPEPGWCDASPFPEHVASCPIGGATGWYTASGPAQPGETLGITIALIDMGDAQWDTATLLDNFRWSCVGCDPLAGECGSAPAG